MSSKSKKKANQTKQNLCQNTGSVSSPSTTCQPQTGAILAVVKDDLGNGVATIAITGPGSKPTGATGSASFESLAVNTYTVTVTTPLPTPVAADFYLPPALTSQPAVVTAGGVAQVAFQLKRRPTPTISTPAPKIVVVKQDYQGAVKPGVKPHRIPVSLSYLGDHDGVGELSCNQATQIRVFEGQDDTVEKALPWTIANAALKGKTVYVEGKAASDAVSSTGLTLTLKEGTIPPKADSATEKITCVLLKLDIYKVRPDDRFGAALRIQLSLPPNDPVIVPRAKRVDPGGNILVQGATDSRLWAHRAKMVVAQAQPEDYAGKLVLKPLSGSVEAFAVETPASGQAALTGGQLEFANAAIDSVAGAILWVQGKSKSAAMADSGWKVELEDVPGQEGDRVTITAFKAELRIFKSRPAAGGDPGQISDDDKIDKGRYLHVQNTDKDHGRAKLVLRNLDPPGLACKLSLSCWNLTYGPYTEAKAATPRVKLFDAEDNGAEVAFGSEIDHPAGVAVGDLKILWVEGATVSGALIDTQIRLDIKDVDYGVDRANSTVVEFTKIKVTIKPTPAHTARAGYPAPAEHTFEATKYTEDFADGKNEPLVLMRNAQPDIALELTAKPALPVDLDILWKAVRNTADAGAIGGKDDLPTVTRDGADKRKAVLSANAKGSFRIRPYIDCNGVDEYSPKEPSMPLNLVLADVAVVADNSAGITTNLTSVLATYFTVTNGTWPGTWPACTAAGGAGMTMELLADVTGGGADGRLGLNKVFGGLVNMLSDNQITLTYTVPPPVPPVVPAPPVVTYTVTNKYVLNRASATGNYGGTPMFKPTDPAPNVIAFPVLDTGRGSGGLGGESATMGRSGVWDAQANQALGIRYTLRCIDSPSRGFLLQHPDHATANLTGIHYVQAFRANFCFWSNVSKARATTGDPADRVYSAARTMDWEAHGDWTITWAANVPTLANTNPHVIAINNPNTVSPIGRAQDNGVECRPPSGITTAISWVTT